METTTITEIPLTDIVPGDNDRTVFDPAALRELADSIEAHGLAQPITVRPIAEGRYQIVAGERRYKAHELLERDAIPAIVREMDDEQADAIMLAENVARADIDPLDEARAYRKRMDKHGWTLAEAAERAGVSPTRIAQRLQLLDLRPELQHMVRTGNLAQNYARKLAQLDHNFQTVAARFLMVEDPPNIHEFGKIVAELVVKQNQAAMFDLDQFMTAPIETLPVEAPSVKQLKLMVEAPDGETLAAIEAEVKAYAQRLMKEGAPPPLEGVRIMIPTTLALPAPRPEPRQKGTARKMSKSSEPLEIHPKVKLSPTKARAILEHWPAVVEFAQTGSLSHENGAKLVSYDTMTVIDLGGKRSKYSQYKAQIIAQHEQAIRAYVGSPDDGDEPGPDDTGPQAPTQEAETPTARPATAQPRTLAGIEIKRAHVLASRLSTGETAGEVMLTGTPPRCSKARRIHARYSGRDSVELYSLYTHSGATSCTLDEWRAFVAMLEVVPDRYSEIEVTPEVETDARKQAGFEHLTQEPQPEPDDPPCAVCGQPTPPERTADTTAQGAPVCVDCVPDPERVAAYEERREERVNRYAQYAENARKRGKLRLDTAHRMASCIPFGQPILVGHHSEQRDRAYRRRIDTNYRKGFEEMDKAKHWERRAEVAERNDTIYTDDPAAAVKLAERITELERQQDRMRAANRIIKTSLPKPEKIHAIAKATGMTPEEIEELFQPDYLGRVGFPDYELRNNRSNIARLKQRLVRVRTQQQRPAQTVEVGEVEVRENEERQSTEIHFPGKPGDELRAEMKRHGWKWSRPGKCWYVKQRGDYILKQGQEFAAAYRGEEEPATV